MLACPSLNLCSVCALSVLVRLPTKAHGEEQKYIQLTRPLSNERRLTPLKMKRERGSLT